MSTTSSIETPTSPMAPPHKHHQHTTTAIVVSAGATAAIHQTQQQQQQQQNIMQQRKFANSANNNHAYTAVACNNTQSNCMHHHQHQQQHDQSTHSLLTPSSSTSSATSSAASVSATASPSVASTSAAVHHHHHQQQQQHNTNPLTSFAHHHIARPSTSLSAPCASSTPSSMKRHADVSVCSSSSSCCSSSSSSSVGVGVGIGVGVGVSVGGTANAATVVTPAVVSGSSGAAVITQKLSRTIPSDKINLRLILVSGKTKEFLFNPSDSAGDIAQTVFDNWPEDWEREAVSKAEILRLIYQGRFLHCNVTLGALGLPLGKTTVMHLVPRDNLPEPNSQDQRQKSKGGSGRCCSTTCCIL